MKKSVLLIFFIFMFIKATFAFDLEMLSKTAPTKLDYPSATALILKDYIKYDYKDDNNVIQTEHEAIKILDYEAIKRFGEIEYIYNADIMNITIEKARMFMPDGKIIENITAEEESPFEKMGAFNSVKIKKIKFNGIQENSIIEYIVKTTTKKNEFKNNFCGMSFFQDYEPIIESNFTVSLPLAKKVFYKNTGTYKIKPRIKYEKGQKIYTWISTNNPVVIKEAASPPFYNEASQVRFSTFASWDEFAKYYWQYVSSSKSLSFNIYSITDKLTAGLKTDEEKIKAIYEYMIKNYNSIDLGFNNTGFAPRKAEEVIKYKIGTSSDITALFINMLKICNIKAYPVFVCTRNFANARYDIVYPYQFDHCLAAIPEVDGLKFIDPTAKYTPVNTIPADIQGQKALVVYPDKASIYTLPIASAEFNKEEIAVEAMIDEKGAIKENIRIKEFGANSVLLRKFFSEFDDLYRKVILVLVARTIAPGAMPLEIYFSDIDKIDEPYNISFTFEAKKFINMNSDLVYFTLPMFPLQNIINMVASDQNERINPVVIDSLISSNKKIGIIIPDNFETKGLPRPIEIKNSVGSYNYSCVFQQNKITAESTLVINKIEVPKSEYSQLKDLVEAAVDTERQLIILKKKDKRPATSD